MEGTIIAGKYRLGRQLGQGGMGSVWLAEHLSLHSPVAIKLIDPGIANNGEALGRFLREAQSAASLRSPHVVQILDHGVDNGVPYIAMELLEGESLADRLTRVNRLSLAEATRIMTHVSRAIGRAHEAGIVHRDLKPDNIYLVRNDDEEIAKVLDFGIAKATTQGGLASSVSGSTRTGAVLGTPYYMSPEQAEGIKSLDFRADIWALGVICFECILGRRPFDAETLGGLLLAICARPMPIPSQYGPVPPGFDQWFARACARDVSARFSSAREAASELRRVCEGSPGVQPNTHPNLPNVSSGNVTFGDSGVSAMSGRGQASSSGLSATDGHGALGGGFSTTQQRKSRAPLFVLSGLGFALVAAGAVGFVLHKAGGEHAAAASVEPVVSQALPVPSAPAELVPQVVPQIPSAPSSQLAAEETAPAAATVAPVQAHLPAASKGVKARPAAKVGQAATTPPPVVPVAPAASAAPPAKPKVNLGI
ncbi:MAG TPA: serine/threonine-protein kinase [Polyangiaceae bacterium]|jgi:serine/threonine-protein kinase